MPKYVTGVSLCDFSSCRDMKVILEDLSRVVLASFFQRSLICESLIRFVLNFGIF